MAVNLTRHLGGTEFDSKLLGNQAQKEKHWVTDISFSDGTTLVKSSEEAKFS